MDQIFQANLYLSRLKHTKTPNNSNKNPINGFDDINAKLQKKAVLKQSLALLLQKMTVYIQNDVHISRKLHKLKENKFKCVIKIRRTYAAENMVNAWG